MFGNNRFFSKLKVSMKSPWVSTIIFTSIDRIFKNKIEKKDDALWFKSKDNSDDTDRVLVKSNGDHTYFLSDIAYHQDKSNRDYDV